MQERQRKLATSYATELARRSRTNHARQEHLAPNHLLMILTLRLEVLQNTMMITRKSEKLEVRDEDKFEKDFQEDWKERQQELQESLYQTERGKY